MPFYGNGTKLSTKSNVDQGSAGNCYIAAPVAAFNLCRVPQETLPGVVARVGYGMGGNSDRAFRAMRLYAFTKTSHYK